MFDLKKLREICPLTTWVEEQVYTILINKGTETKFAIRLAPKDAKADFAFREVDFRRHYMGHKPNDGAYGDEYFVIRQVVEKSIYDLYLYKERVYQLVNKIHAYIRSEDDVTPHLDALAVHLSERKLSLEYAQKWAEYIAYIDVNYNPKKNTENDENSRWHE
jgi:hypothetical protein